MPVSYKYSGPLSGALALELLAKLQDTELAVSATAGTKPTLTVVTTNPIVGSSTTASADSWVSCAKAISSVIPSLNFWNDNDASFEEWIHSASIILGKYLAIVFFYRDFQDEGFLSPPPSPLSSYIASLLSQIATQKILWLLSYQS